MADKISYFNTLVFTIISGIVSLVLLVLLFMGVFKPELSTFVITVEVGIFLIIAICIWQIVANEKTLDKYREAKNFSIDFTQCPDYFVEKQNPDGTKVCSNEFVVDDKYKNRYIMKIYPADNPGKNEVYSLPAMHTSAFSPSSLVRDKFLNTSFNSAPSLKTLRDKCAAAMGQDPAYKEYSVIPWVGVRARCESF